MALKTVKEHIESRLNVDIPDSSNIVTTDDVDQFIQDGVAEIYRHLIRQGAIEELKLFMGTTEVPRLLDVTSNTATPTIFTAAGHDYTAGTYVKFTSMTNLTGLNDTTARVASVGSPGASNFVCDNIYSSANETGGKVQKLDGVNSYTSNPIDASSKFFDAGFFVVERKKNHTKGVKAMDTGGASIQWYPCREIQHIDMHKAQDPMSPEYATDEHPIYLQTSKNQEIEVWPAPSNDNPIRLWGLKNYTEIVNTTQPADAQGLDFPDGYWLALVYYTVSQSATSYMANSMKALGQLSWSDQTSVSRLVDSAPSVPYELQGILSIPPTFVKPTLSADYSRLNAFLDDDDQELGAIAANKVQQEITEYAQDIQNELGKYNKEAKVWETEVQHAWKDADGELQAKIAEFQNEVQRYTVNVQAYTQDIQHEAGKMGAEIQKLSANIQSFTALSQLYDVKFKEYVTLRVPQQSKGQGAQNAG